MLDSECTVSSGNSGFDRQIFVVMGWLDDRGFGARIREIPVKETSKSFVAQGRRIGKDRLMKVDTHIIENHKNIRYFTYCLDGEQQQALNMIKAHIIDKIKTYKQEVDALYSFVR